MLIVTADDYGREHPATDSILLCGARGRITAASAMVFMRDSERAATLAADSEVEFGLHLNFTEPLDEASAPGPLRLHHDRVRRFLTRHRLAPVLFSPWLRQSFRIVFEAQRDEYERLYHGSPGFYNGHHHMHLCPNVLMDGLLPRSARIRNSFTFEAGEKSLLNRVYRGIVRRWIGKRYTSTDVFYSIAPVHDLARLQRLMRWSLAEAVEIETHPEDASELTFLLSDRYQELLRDTRPGGFRDLARHGSVVRGAVPG